MKGLGPPLLYLHGAHGLRWGHYLETLAQQFTVYALEFPGTTPGEHAAASEMHDLLDVLVFYRELIDALELNNFSVVGESFGGMIGLELAALLPGRISRAVFASPLGLWYEGVPDSQFALETLEALPTVLSSAPDRADKDAYFPWLVRETSAEERAAAIWAMGVAAKLLWPIADRGLSRRIHLVAAPVLFLWGDRDAIQPVSHAEHYVKCVKDSAVEVLPGTGHMVFADAPSSASQRTLEFLLK